MDESGHDHRTMPYEVRGGVAIDAQELWAFVREFKRLEQTSFGVLLAQFKKELKGSRLLDKDRFKWAAQDSPMLDEARRKQCRRFLTKGLEHKSPAREEFTAYGQASLEMARGIFQLLRDRKAVVFAAAIPRGVKKPDSQQAEEYLRKDHVFLLERFFYFLEGRQTHGLIVLDETEKTEDRRFVSRVEAYYKRTQTGRYRTAWIVPTPIFAASDMTYPIQAADLVIYCVNWGFRLPSHGMDAPQRDEVATEFGPWLNQLQFTGQAYRDGQTFHSYGVVYVPDPYTGRQVGQETKRR